MMRHDAGIRINYHLYSISRTDSDCKPFCWFLSEALYTVPERNGKASLPFPEFIRCLTAAQRERSCDERGIGRRITEAGKTFRTGKTAAAYGTHSAAILWSRVQSRAHLNDPEQGNRFSRKTFHSPAHFIGTQTKLMGTGYKTACLEDNKYTIM